MSEYFICPHCEARVPAGARACPECGSDERTGWSDSAEHDELFLPPAEHAAPARRRRAGYLIPALLLLLLATFLLPLVSTLPWGVYLIPPALLGAGVAAYLARARRPAQDPEERELYQRLLEQAAGDAELVERLVEYERRRSPGATRVQLLRDAAFRWRRDRR